MEPTARSRDRSARRCGSTPDFRQLAWKAAPAPKKVQPVSAENRHSVPQSGTSPRPAGLPSYRQRVVPPNKALTWQFHMIQAVEVAQWKRSPVSTLGPRLLCSTSIFKASTITPPWLCTMGLGRPVVPLE